MPALRAAAKGRRDSPVVLRNECPSDNAEDSSKVRERDTSAISLEKILTEIGLESPNRLTERWLGNMQSMCRTADVPHG